MWTQCPYFNVGINFQTKANKQNQTDKQTKQTIFVELISENHETIQIKSIIIKSAYIYKV